MSNDKGDVISLLNEPQSLISFMKNSSDHWTVKDIAARYMFINDSASDFYRFPKRFNVQGKYDKEVPTDICQDLWYEFEESDKRVVEKNKKIVSIAIHHYGKGNTRELIPHYSEKIPLYNNENKIIGIVSNGRRLEGLC